MYNRYLIAAQSPLRGSEKLWRGEISVSLGLSLFYMFPSRNI